MLHYATLQPVEGHSAIEDDRASFGHGIEDRWRKPRGSAVVKRFQGFLLGLGYLNLRVHRALPWIVERVVLIADRQRCQRRRSGALSIETLCDAGARTDTQRYVAIF